MAEAAQKPDTETKPTRWVWSKIQEEKQVRTRYVVTAPARMTVDDLQEPKVFGALSATFRRHDVIEIIGNDGTWWAVVRVQRATPDTVLLAFKGPGLGVGKLEAATSGDDDDPLYRCEYRGEADRWTVIRKKDEYVMVRGHASLAGARIARAQLYPRPVS